MPEMTDILDRLVAAMQGVASAGVVGDRLRSVVIGRAGWPDRLAKLCSYEPDGFRGWFPDYQLSTEREGVGLNGKPLELGQIERILRFKFRWVLPYDDTTTPTSTAKHGAMFEDMAAMFRQNRSFGYGRGLVEHRLLQGNPPGEPVALSESKGSMHFGEATLDVRVLITVTNAC